MFAKIESFLYRVRRRLSRNEWAIRHLGLTPSEGTSEEPGLLLIQIDGLARRQLEKSVEELELSVRSSNCLRAAEIKTIGDLVVKSESEMLKYRNFGRKSLKEIQDLLAEMGLSFGMDLSRFYQPKTPPPVEG